MKVRKKQNQRKKGGGITKLKNFISIFILLICLSSKTFELQAKTTISIIRDAEIEFFIQKIINNFTENDIDKNNIIKPIIRLGIRQLFVQSIQFLNFNCKLL